MISVPTPACALAPTLQILLSKMWDQSQRQNVDVPSFDQSLYEGLRKRGLLLDDFLAQQLASLRAWRSDVVDSGLALDLLEYHTTPLGTAEQRTRSELLARYPHRSEVLESLVDQCKSLYLLIRSQAGTEPANRLAHDTLAPLVQDRFRASVAPGQRARRVLENRASEWQGEQSGAVLDTQDLKVVEAGASGMRAWTAPETRLVEASRRDEELRQAAENKRKRLLRALRVSVAGLAVLASLAAVVATIEKRQAVEATKTARTEAENAQCQGPGSECQARGRAREKRGRAPEERGRVPG